MTRWVMLLGALCSLLAGASAACDPWNESRGDPGAAAPRSPAAPATVSATPGNLKPTASALPPLRSEGWLVELPVPGFGPVTVAPPEGVRSPRPVLVALHGYGDRPNWQCGAWWSVTGGNLFVVCPQGVALPAPPGNFAFGSVADTEREVKAALEVLTKHYAGYVSADVVLAGFSLGAERAAALGSRDPKSFPRVALVEGGVRSWTSAASTRFRNGGGRRLLLACSQAGCQSTLEALARRSRGEHTLVQVAYLGALGHTLGPRATEQLKAPWQWLAQGLL